jgi:hypothetical protein
MNSQISFYLDVMEDIEQDTTDNQHKIIMDSSMEIRQGKVETKINTCIYAQKEFGLKPVVSISARDTVHPVREIHSKTPLWPGVD